VQLDVMTGGLPLRRMQDLAQECQAAGIAGLVVTEAGRTAYLSCAAAALVADGLHLATGVAVAFPRSPMISAQVAWELAEATGGRFRLGLGTQIRTHAERRYGVAFDPPGPRLREHVLAVRACFAAFRGDAPLAFEGQYHRLTFLSPVWSPGRLAVSDPPVDIAAVNPWMLRMAGEVADGVHVHPLATEPYLRDVVRPNVAEGASRAGRAARDIALLVPAHVVVGDSEEERQPWREVARAQIAFYATTPNYRFILEGIGHAEVQDRVRARQKAGDLAGMAAEVTDDMLAHFTVTASWDDLSSALRQRFGGVADRLIVYAASTAWQRDPSVLSRFGEVARDLSG
jgi:probable F420-dependent oxidoreductase